MAVGESAVQFIDPASGRPLVLREGGLHDGENGGLVAPIIDGIPRFVEPAENYAESFGWQWKRWAHARSDARNPGHNLRKTVVDRTGFTDDMLRGATVLECGMGGGDDTEILLQFPLRELHSFDISTSVERGSQYLHDDRLTISQASIYEIPYPDEAFDVVYCHRVLQHTPDPVRALASICRKVRPGGLLFAHAYKRSIVRMMEWRYKYRWLAKRLPWPVVHGFTEHVGPSLHRFVQAVGGNPVGLAMVHSFVPWYYLDPRKHTHLSPKQQFEMAQHITFDALTPWHDHPMTSRQFFGTIRAAGFEILRSKDPVDSPLYCTARRFG